MENYNIPIGGEFWFQSDLQNSSINNKLPSNGTLLDGGIGALRFILNDICFNNNEILLLPSYLCPTIIDLVKSLNIQYSFYSINSKLEIDTTSIEEIISKFNVKAVLFINYFGIYHSDITKNFLINLKNKGVFLIEDAVQTFWISKSENFIGTYVFNSFRKFLPIDGSIVLSNKQHNFTPINDEYFSLINMARHNKTSLIYKGIGDEYEILSIFEKANISYYKRSEIHGMNYEDINFLKRLPIEQLITKRRENCNFLLSKIANTPKISLIYNFANFNSTVPLAIPILINNRDYIRSELMKYKIYTPIHWNLNKEVHIQNFADSLTVSNTILSLPIDWRYDLHHMEYLSKALKNIISDSSL